MNLFHLNESIPWGPRFRAAYYASILARCSLSCSGARKDSIEHKAFHRLGSRQFGNLQWMSTPSIENKRIVTSLKLNPTADLPREQGPLQTTNSCRLHLQGQTDNQLDAAKAAAAAIEPAMLAYLERRLLLLFPCIGTLLAQCLYYISLFCSLSNLKIK